MNDERAISTEKVNQITKWAPALILSLALAIIIIDTTLLNVSLGNIIRDLNTDIQSIQWVITAYSLTLAALTITGGRLGDLFGRKRMFVLGAVIFAIGSFIASASSSVGMMITGESIIEGIGAALMMPATSSLLISTYKGKDRAIAMGMWGGIAAASSAVGPILGGFLATNYSWRWGFRINIFVAAILVIGSFLVKEYRDREEKPNLDFGGIILSSVGLLSLVFGVIESSTYGWWRAKETFIAFGHNLNFGSLSVVPIALLLGIILLTLFVIWELRVAKTDNTPLVSMDIFKNNQFTSGVLTTTLMSIGQAGLIFSLPVFYQAVRGLDSYHTGLAFLPMSISALIFAPLGAILGRKIAPKRIIQFGLASGTLGLIIIRSKFGIDANTSDFFIGMVLYGIGLGSTMAQLSNMTLSAVSTEEAGEASGVNNTLRQIGSTFGSAIIGAALLTAISTNVISGINNSTVIPASLKPQIVSAMSSQTSNIEFGGGAQMGQKTPEYITQELATISKQATVDSNKLAALYAIIFMLIGLIASGWLTSSKNLERNQSAAKGH
jgi:EmrB/QacA subfamily drug resistance transporter